MRCTTCEHENPTDARFCNDFGAALVVRCSACDCENPQGSRFCDSCGVELAAVGTAAQREFRSLGERLVSDPMDAYR